MLLIRGLTNATISFDSLEFQAPIFYPSRVINKHTFQAISCLKRALWVSPLNWKTLFNLGLAHLATSQPASAFNFICAAVNLRSDDPDCFAVLACEYCRFVFCNFNSVSNNQVSYLYLGELKKGKTLFTWKKKNISKTSYLVSWLKFPCTSSGGKRVYIKALWLDSEEYSFWELFTFKIWSIFYLSKDSVLMRLISKSKNKYYIAHEILCRKRKNMEPVCTTLKRKCI